MRAATPARSHGEGGQVDDFDSFLDSSLSLLSSWSASLPPSVARSVSMVASWASMGGMGGIAASMSPSVGSPSMSEGWAPSLGGAGGGCRSGAVTLGLLPYATLQGGAGVARLG